MCAVNLSFSVVIRWVTIQFNKHGINIITGNPDFSYGFLTHNIAHNLSILLAAKLNCIGFFSIICSKYFSNNNNKILSNILSLAQVFCLEVFFCMPPNKIKQIATAFPRLFCYSCLCGQNWSTTCCFHTAELSKSSVQNSSRWAHCLLMVHAVLWTIL